MRLCARETGERGLIESSHAYLGAMQSACCWTANDDSLANIVCPQFSSAADSDQSDQYLPIVVYLIMHLSH